MKTQRARKEFRVSRVRADVERCQNEIRKQTRSATKDVTVNKIIVCVESMPRDYPMTNYQRWNLTTYSEPQVSVEPTVYFTVLMDEKGTWMSCTVAETRERHLLQKIVCST